MSNEGCFTLHRVSIPVHNLNKPTYLIPYGDIHRFAPLCDVDKWLEFCKEYSTKKDTLFLGMGDYDDLASMSERKALNSCDLHEATLDTFDRIYAERCEKLAKELSFMKGKLVGLLEGNHYGVFMNGMTTTQKLCELLNCKYLGCSAFIRLSFILGGKASSIDIWANHGTAASRTLGSSISSVEKMEQVAEADIYLSGHDHRKYAALKAKLRLGTGNGGIRLNQRQILLGRTGSFLKGYVEGEPSYIARRALPPTDLGVIEIELKMHRKRVNGGEDFHVDIHCRT